MTMTMTKEQLQHALEQHRLWLAGEGGKKADLSGADLSGADLSYADLTGADLRGANLSGADLRSADLSRANLSRADLSRADLSGADLRRADLSRADLSGVILGDDMPRIENIHQRVYEAASQEGALDMTRWHTCDTTHCRAGWVVMLAGEAGKALEEKYGTPNAASLIYAKSDPNIGMMPNFYCDNETALDDMKARAEQEARG